MRSTGVTNAVELMILPRGSGRVKVERHAKNGLKGLLRLEPKAATAGGQRVARYPESGDLIAADQDTDQL